VDQGLGESSEMASKKKQHHRSHSSSSNNIHHLKSRSSSSKEDRKSGGGGGLKRANISIQFGNRRRTHQDGQDVRPGQGFTQQTILNIIIY
jgi:hypothetical protein